MVEIRRLSPEQAWRQMQEEPESLFLDVRDPIESAFVGQPTGAVNIPWKTAPTWEPNPGFVDQVRRLDSRLDRPIFLLCRSGQRSLDAALALATAGYRDLTNIEEGFEGPLDSNKHRGTLGGWRYRGLPWEQS